MWFPQNTPMENSLTNSCDVKDGPLGDMLASSQRSLAARRLWFKRCLFVCLCLQALQRDEWMKFVCGYGLQKEEVVHFGNNPDHILDTSKS